MQELDTPRGYVGWMSPLPFSRSHPQMRDACPIPGNPELGILWSSKWLLIRFYYLRNIYRNTVVSKIITPEFFLNELIRRGVIYYAGNFSPQIIFFWINYAG